MLTTLFPGNQTVNNGWSVLASTNNDWSFLETVLSLTDITVTAVIEQSVSTSCTHKFNLHYCLQVIYIHRDSGNRLLKQYIKFNENIHQKVQKLPGLFIHWYQSRGVGAHTTSQFNRQKISKVIIRTVLRIDLIYSLDIPQKCTSWSFDIKYLYFFWGVSINPIHEGQLQQPQGHTPP